MPPQQGYYPQPYGYGPGMDSLALQDVRQTAAKDLSTPLSYMGMAHMIWPMSRGSGGFLNVLRRVGVFLLLLVTWLLPTMFYAIIFGFWPFAIGWLIFTTSRRRSIRNARDALAGRAA